MRNMEITGESGREMSCLTCMSWKIIILSAGKPSLNEYVNMRTERTVGKRYWRCTVREASEKAICWMRLAVK